MWWKEYKFKMEFTSKSVKSFQFDLFKQIWSFSQFYLGKTNFSFEIMLIQISSEEQTKLIQLRICHDSNKI